MPCEDRGISFCRWIIHAAFSWRLPYYWSFDDNVIAFVAVTHACKPTPITFADALLHVQRLPTIANFALTGFLRATGTERCKTNPYLTDHATIYKVLLVNCGQCAGCNYVPILCKWEDIAFSCDLLDAGKHILKVQCLAYHAITTQGGGCQPERSSDALVHSWAGDRLAPHATCVVQQLRAWLEAHNRKPAPPALTATRAIGTQQAPSAPPPPKASMPSPSQLPASQPPSQLPASQPGSTASASSAAAQPLHKPPPLASIPAADARHHRQEQRPTFEPEPDLAGFVVGDDEIEYEPNYYRRLRRGDERIPIPPKAHRGVRPNLEPNPT